MERFEKNRQWDAWRLPIIGVQLLLILILWRRGRMKKHRDFQA